MQGAIRCDDPAMKPCSTNVMNNVDRISWLSDDILIHILSFIPTNDAIVTSILSKRWTHVYTYIPNLEFNDFLTNNDRLACFVTHVDNVLRANQCKALNRFNLKLAHHHHQNSSLLKEWILYSLLRRVKELNLSINYVEQIACAVELPDKVFTCETLEVLKLEGNLDMKKLPNNLCLPNLKVCHLKSMKSPECGFLRSLLSGCPSIIHLSMEDCGRDGDLETIHISSPSLRILVVKDKAGRSPARSNLVLETPNLEHLEYADYLAQGYSIGNLNALVTASIEIAKTDGPSGGFESLLNLLRPLSNVRELTLQDSWGLRFLRKERDEIEGQLPVFWNLEHLKLTIPDRMNWRKGTLELLERSPFLKKFTLTGFSDLLRAYDTEAEWRVLGDANRRIGWGKFGDPHDIFFGAAYKEIPSCLRLHLKKMVIRISNAIGWEVRMLGYFLRNASVLQELEVLFDGHGTHTEDALQKLPRATLTEDALQKLPRASPNCVIKVLPSHLHY